MWPRFFGCCIFFSFLLNVSVVEEEEEGENDVLAADGGIGHAVAIWWWQEQATIAADANLMAPTIQNIATNETFKQLHFWLAEQTDIDNKYLFLLNGVFIEEICYKISSD